MQAAGSHDPRGFVLGRVEVFFSLFPGLGGYFMDRSSAPVPKHFSSGDVISNNVGGIRFNFATVALRSGYPGLTFYGAAWPVGQPGFAGFSLKQPDGVHFGWLKLQWGADAGGFPNSETVLGWAYSDVAGEAILAGQTGPVPEPAAMTLAVLGAGSAGVLALRRRRKEKPATQSMP